MCSTVAIRSATLTPGPKSTRARSVAKFTVASTPSIRLSFFSIRAAQEAQVIPPIESSMRSLAVAAFPAVVVVLI